MEEEKDNVFSVNRFLDTLNDNNERIVILGPSSTGKTSLGINLVLFYMKKYKKHIYLYDSVNKLINTYSRVFKDLCNIEIEKFSTENIDEFIDNYLNDDFLKSGGMKGTLLFIDDISHKINDSKLKFLLNKAYTSSRQCNYDIICILHKLKLNNKMMLQNATKIAITKLDIDEEEYFKDIIVKKNVYPIFLDMLDGKQKILDFSGFKNMTITELIQRIKITNKNDFPKLYRNKSKKAGKFIEIKIDNDPEFQIPTVFKRLTEKEEKRILKENEIIKKGEEYAVGLKENKIQKNVENKIDLSKYFLK